MNNSKIAIDNIEREVQDNTLILQHRKAELLRIMEAIERLSKIPEWQVLKELIFDKAVEKLEKSLLNEAKKIELNSPEMYRLQGELKWAKRYSDIYKLAETYKIELNNITKKLNENA